jgi:uncharacterized protein (TIGR02453 family)
MIERILSFLKELEKNNNREWFRSNKRFYDEARTQMENLVNRVIPGIARFDPSVKLVDPADCMFRIFRDVRFSKDKSPYKTNFGAWITRSGRKSCGPGYYIHLQPGRSFLAGGVYMPDPVTLKKIRQEIYYNPEEFGKILENQALKKVTNGLDDMDRLKNAPREFSPGSPGIEWLKNRHYTVSSQLPDKQILDPAFPDIAVNIFRAMYPLNTFLGRAVEG